MSLLTTLERSVEFTIIESISDIAIHSYPISAGLSNSIENQNGHLHPEILHTNFHSYFFTFLLKNYMGLCFYLTHWRDL